jgi:hypothetical protein
LIAQLNRPPNRIGAACGFALPAFPTCAKKTRADLESARAPVYPNDDRYTWNVP